MIICKAEIITSAPVKVCGSSYFENIMQLVALSPFESQKGTAEIQMIPGFRCAECGAVLDLNNELNHKINGVLNNG